LAAVAATTPDEASARVKGKVRGKGRVKERARAREEGKANPLRR